MAPMDGMLGDAQRAHQEARVEILDVHKRVAKLGCWRNLSRGWESLGEASSKCARGTYKTLAVAGTGLTAVFSGFSFLFGGLAIKQGFADFLSGMNASVIGHFAEWTNMGLQVLTIPVKEFYAELGAIGSRRNVKELFEKAMENAEEIGTRESLYRNHLKTLRDMPASNWVLGTPFPLVSETIDPGEESRSLLYRDFHLQKEYREIAADLKSLSWRENSKLGWRIIAHQQGERAVLGIRIASGTTAVYLAVNLTVYGAGIAWSGMQAVEDLHNGDNPSIGGHVLEWADEAYTVVRGAFSYLGEIANVGRKANLVLLFRERIRNAEDDDFLSREEKQERLEQVMQWIVPQMSRGYFYDLPSWFMYAEDPMSHLDEEELVMVEDGKSLSMEEL